MDGHIMLHGIISSRQSAATSEIVKRCCSESRKQRYNKYPDLYLFTFYLVQVRLSTQSLGPVDYVSCQMKHMLDYH